MAVKTPDQIGREFADTQYMDEDDWLADLIAQAIEADRAQRPEPVEMTLYSVQVPNRPTFYLDAQIQGITDLAHAVRVAEHVLGCKVSFRNVMAIHYQVQP